MATTFVLTAASVFPPGTVVGAYVANSGEPPVDRAPNTAVVDTQTMGTSSLTFTGLAEGRRYWAYAEVASEHRYVTFTTGGGAEQSGLFTDLDVTGDLTVTDQLTVGGAAEFNGAVDFNAGVDLSGATVTYPADLATQAELDAVAAAKQGLDATLTALAGVATAADKLIYATGADAFTTADLTAAGRALLDDANAAAQLTTLGVSTFAQTLLDDADAAAARTTLGLAVTPASAAVRKTADETVNNSATLQNDDHLVLTVGANEVWAVDVRLLLQAASGTPDWKFGFTVPAAATFYWGSERLATVSGGWAPNTQGGGIPAALLTTGTQETESASGTITGAHLLGTYVGGANAGTLQFQWAQISAHASDSKVLAGSCLVATKVS